MASLDLRQVIVRPLVTEKSSAVYQLHKAYTFQVHPEASKPQIRQALETLFDVTVTDVRTMQMRAKARKAGGMGRGREGRRGQWKKAIVVLKEGDAIPIFEG